MKTRLQLVRGLTTGTLSREDEQEAAGNPIVIAEAARIRMENETPKPICTKPKKGGKHARFETS